MPLHHSFGVEEHDPDVGTLRRRGLRCPACPNTADESAGGRKVLPAVGLRVMDMAGSRTIVDKLRIAKSVVE